MKIFSVLFILFTLPALAQDATRPGDVQGVQTNPMYGDKGSKGANPLFEQTRRLVQDISNSLRPPVSTRVRNAVEELQANPDLNGPADKAWKAAADAVRRAFGSNLSPDALESLTAVVAGLAVIGKGNDTTAPVFGNVSNVLKTKHDTVKNAINNVR